MNKHNKSIKDDNKEESSNKKVTNNPTLIIKNLMKDPYLLNLSNNNNFYISKKILEEITLKSLAHDKLSTELATQNKEVEEKDRLLLKSLELTNDEKKILELYDNRKEICINDKIHYFVINRDPYDARCHYCNISIVEGTRT